MSRCGLLQNSLFRLMAAIVFMLLPNARPEWRGADDVEMQTGRAIPRPLQAARYARECLCK